MQHLELTAGIPGPVNAAETLVASVTFSAQVAAAPVPPAANIGPTMIAGVLNVTPGTSTTAVVLRIRQGNGVAGAVVGNADTVTLAAAASGTIAFQKLDPVGAVQYSITLQQTGGAATGTVNSLSADFDQNLSGRV